MIIENPIDNPIDPIDVPYVNEDMELVRKRFVRVISDRLKQQKRKIIEALKNHMPDDFHEGYIDFSSKQWDELMELLNDKMP
jgi:hypothetical protein